MSIIVTHSGIEFDLLNPTVDMIEIEDIAHSLNMICRYNGHAKRFYSVAEHSLRMSHVVAPGFAFEALMHDAAEAYVGDMVSPLKQLIPDFKNIEHNIHKTIAEKFGLPYPISKEVKVADWRMMQTEKIALMPEPKQDGRVWWPPIDEYPPFDNVHIDTSYAFHHLDFKNYFLEVFGRFRK